MDEIREKLKDSIEHDEQILWYGAPADYEPMNKTYKPYYTRRTISTAVIMIAIIVLYIVMAIKTGAGIKVGMVVVLLVVTVYAICMPLLDNNKLRKCQYVLTDRKIMLVFPSEVRSVKLEAIPTARFATDADGYTSLLCGPDCDNLAPHNYRVSTLTGAMLNQDTMICDRFVMYAINDPAGFKTAANGYLTIM
jgi:hypothetical protein